MRIRRVVQKRIQQQADGLNVAGSINAVISGNVGESGSVSHLKTRSSNRIVQRGGTTQIVSDQQTDEQPTQRQEVDQ